MSGVAVVWSLLANNAALIQEIPAARIKAGVLPLKTALPAIGVMSVSSIRRNTTGMNEAQTLVTERVQATVMVKRSAQGGADYPALTRILRLARQACPQTTGTVNGVTVCSVLPDIEGPDLEAEDLGVMTRSQDWIVSWKEAR